MEKGVRPIIYFTKLARAPRAPAVNVDVHGWL